MNSFFKKNSIPRISKNIKNYAWGKSFEASLVARYAAEDQADKSKNYAELWIGNHSSSPSEIIIDNIAYNFSQLIRDYPEDLLGAKTCTAFNNELPFLLKVLSIGKPLSIQSHPDKESASRLNRLDPAHYPDNNHKPEIVIALTEMTLLHDLRTSSEITEFLEYYDFRGLAVSGKEINYPDLFSRVFNLSPEDLQTAIESISRKINSKPQSEITKHDRLFQQLIQDYPQDPGLLIIFFLNIKQLLPGQAYFTGPGIPHAYLSGDAIECMAASDNTIRGGLTPKFIDKEVFCESLKLIDDNRRGGAIPDTSTDKNINLFATHASEFFIRVHHGSSTKQVSLQSCEIVFSVDARGTIESSGIKAPFLPGDAFLLPYCYKSYTVNVDSGKVITAGVP